MKLRNSVLHMMLCTASTLYLTADAKTSDSGHTVLPGPGGQKTTVQGSQRPRVSSGWRRPVYVVNGSFDPADGKQ
eukprot:4044609-Prymnesium_polylepis.1